jgi:dienelactone hydrolase
MIQFPPSGPTLAAESKFAAADVLNGLAWSKELCVGPGRINVEVRGQSDCIRCYGIEVMGAHRDPVIFFEGDVAVRNGKDAKGQPVWSVKASYLNLSPWKLQAEAERFGVSAERTFVNLARPGTYGSTGNHLDRRREREVALIDSALDQLKAQFGWVSITLSGQSGGGHLVAALAGRRSDISCAIIASGNVSVRKRAQELGFPTTDVTGHSEFYDPIEHVSDVRRHAPGRIIVLTDPKDGVVSAKYQTAYCHALRDADVVVEQRKMIGEGAKRHRLRVPAIVAGLTS